MNNIPSDYRFLAQAALDFLTRYPNFKTKFQAIAPEIYADIESASTNPNCSCRNKVENYVFSNRESCANLINSFISENNIPFNIDEFTAIYQTTPYHGVVETVKTQDWFSYVDGLMQKKAIFRSFSVVKIDEETINVFFI